MEAKLEGLGELRAPKKSARRGALPAPHEYCKDGVKMMNIMKKVMMTRRRRMRMRTIMMRGDNEDDEDEDDDDKEEEDEKDEDEDEDDDDSWHWKPYPSQSADAQRLFFLAFPRTSRRRRGNQRPRRGTKGPTLGVYRLGLPLHGLA